MNLLLLLKIWGGGGVLAILITLIGAGGWEGLKEEVEDDFGGFVSNETAAGLLLLLAFLIWPYLLLETLYRRFFNH